MNRVTWIIPAALGFGMLLITACSQLLPASGNLPSSHPEALPQGRPICSECHETTLKDSQKPYTVFDHTPSFVKDHRFAAQAEERTCAICHKQSFCTDCHANHNEIKPSLKMGDRPDRDLVHRGDYMTRHKFEGKLDPASCYRCHGRANNEKCVTCHR
jgi:hypothetical protein